MAKKKKNIIQRIISHPIFTNLLIMVGIFIILVFITLFILKIYTKHNESISVPALKGLQINEAEKLLYNKDLTYEIVDSAYRADAKPGAILEQIPKENSKVKKGRVVFLVTQAKAKQMVTIPMLKDYSRRQATVQLNSLGINNVIIIEVPAQFSGLVISLEYNGAPLVAGQRIPKGSTVRMYVGGGGGGSEMPTETIEETPTPDVDQSFF